jgi:NitT/TauT family transport system substrate-binding protein
VWRTVLEEITVGFLKQNNIQAEVIRINEGVNIFLKDAVDICVIMYYNEYNKLVNFGIDPNELNVFQLKDYAMNFPEDGIYCKEETIDRDPELCRKFVQASLEGWEYAFSNPEETIQIVRRIQKQEQVADNNTHTRWMLSKVHELIQPDVNRTQLGLLDEVDFNNTVLFLLNNKEINEDVKYSEFYRGLIKK